MLLYVLIAVVAFCAGGVCEAQHLRGGRREYNDAQDTPWDRVDPPSGVVVHRPEIYDWNQEEV